MQRLSLLTCTEGTEAEMAKRSPDRSKSVTDGWPQGCVEPSVFNWGQQEPSDHLLQGGTSPDDLPGLAATPSASPPSEGLPALASCLSRITVRKLSLLTLLPTTAAINDTTNTLGV